MFVAVVTVLTTLGMEPGAALPRELALREDFLQASLDRAERPARIWYFGWVSAFSAGLAVRSTLAFAGATEGIRVDSQVGMVTLAAGLGVTLALTPRTLYAGDSLRAEPERTFAERLEKVRRGEELLVRGAEREKLGRSWIPHVAGIALNLGAGAYLALHEQRWTSGIVQAAAGIAVSELKILTQPTTASDALAAYRRRERGEATAREATTPKPPEPEQPTLALGALPFGLVIAGSF